ncbi:hypothetical protein P7C71_g6013, partial [Lecanoromycetidae sp. Uapishka_2]
MEKQKIWVILIGIDFYRASIQLKGAVNDVKIMKSYFSGAKQGSINLSTFTASNPKKSNAQNPPEEASAWPTYDNVTSKIKDISRDASPGDLVYIHYSGHGTRESTASAEYSEHNSSDIALVLFDEEQDERYLRGLDLAGLLEDMVKKKVKVAIALDCCFSGGVTRGDSCIRGLDWDDGVDANHPLLSRDDDMLSALEDSNFLRPSTDHVNRQEICSYQIDRDESHYKIFDDTYEEVQNLPSISMNEKKPEISVVNALEHVVKYKLIESLENHIPAPILERSFQISFTDSSDTELDPAGAMEIQDNGKFTIKFHNTSRMPLFLSLHCLNPLWQIDSIYRAGGGPDYYVIQPEDASLKHTGKRRVTITMRIPEELKRKGCRRCDDVLKVFVTAKGTSFATLRLGKVPGCGQEEATRGHSTQLSSFLDGLAAPRRGRVDDAQALENEWATRNYVVRTVNRS